MYLRQSSRKPISRTRPGTGRAKTPQEVEEEKLIERVLARETPAEKRERALRCLHGDMKSSCLRCAGLSEAEIQKWNKHRTKGRFIRRKSGTLNRYIPVRISRADCTFVSGPEEAVPESEVSDWNIGNGAKEKDYADVSIPARVRRPEKEEVKASILRDLYMDPNSRFQPGGSGYLRIPLDALRSTRADAPEWIDLRDNFLRTLKLSRAARAEKILFEFYVEGKTDSQIAETLNWAKDSVKKERKLLVQQGGEFFQRQPAQYPPSPALSEGRDHDPRTGLHSPIYPAAEARSISRLRSERAYSVSPTNFVAVCSPEPNVLYVYPLFEENGQRFARNGAREFVPVASLKGFLREECSIPRERAKGGFDAQDTELKM